MSGMPMEFRAHPQKPLKSLRETADTRSVQKTRIMVLKQIIDDSLYVVDERAVAKAIVARACVRETVADPVFRSERRPSMVRSFRRTHSARSFRLTNGPLAAGRHH
jgi:hypothetical protein